MLKVKKLPISNIVYRIIFIKYRVLSFTLQVFERKHQIFEAKHRLFIVNVPIKPPYAFKLKNSLHLHHFYNILNFNILQDQHFSKCEP